MANNQKNVQPNVVTTTTTTTRRRGGRRRRRTPRPSQAGTTTVRKVTINRQSRRPPRRRRVKPGNPPKSSNSMYSQRITATLGSVGANKGDGIELEMSALINPALMKETTGSNQFGPLQIAASTYNYWRVQYLDIKLTPLVGASAVSGTVIRTSLNLAAQPGSAGWSALGARKHKDTSPGKPITFRVRGSDIMGPKEGWFCCNTKNDPQMCLGGSIEIHTLGKTMSTYKSDIFDGPLFLAEVTALWQFKNYNPQPGMLNLIKAETTEPEKSVKINATPGEPITISVPTDSSFARAIGQADLGINADASPSEIIWQVCDTTVEVVEGILPPPFQWLIKAGWWFLKRIANKKKSGDHIDGQPDANEVTFQIYQSMSDAMNDVPCIATGNAASTNKLSTGWNITQVTPGNVGQSQDAVMTTRSMPQIDVSKPFYLLRDRVKSGESIITGMNFNDRWGVPLNGFAVKDITSQKKVYSYYSYELLDPYFYQGTQIDPATADVNTYPMLKKQADTYTSIGRVYGTASLVTDGQDKIRWCLVLWRADQTTSVVRQPGNDVNLEFFILQPSLSQSGGYPTTNYTMQKVRSLNPGQQTIQIEKGKWYLTPFTALNGREEFNNYGASFPFPTSLYNGPTLQFDPIMDFYYVGLALNNAIPLRFNFPVANTTPVTLSMVHQLVQQALAERNNQELPFSTLPLPSEYDNLEIPPLEGEEKEELQGAVGGADLQRDIKNWVEFDHRKRPPTPLLPIEEEEEDEDSDLDDDDYAEPPSIIKNLLTPEAKDLYGDLRRKGLSHEQATKAAQAAFPHPALEAWEAAYHNAMADGLSPPTARDCAWSAVSDFLS
uniref:Capsid protein n=1 Tax=Mamastrovirus 4 TaxID=1239568 RepID=A0A1Y0JW70_9VIRU|nr:capsid protein [Mamastrovirus 4]